MKLSLSPKLMVWDGFLNSPSPLAPLSWMLMCFFCRFSFNLTPIWTNSGFWCYVFLTLWITLIVDHFEPAEFGDIDVKGSGIMCGLCLLASLSPYVLIVGMWLLRISKHTIYPKIRNKLKIWHPCYFIVWTKFSRFQFHFEIIWQVRELGEVNTDTKCIHMNMYS